MASPVDVILRRALLGLILAFSAAGSGGEVRAQAVASTGQGGEAPILPGDIVLLTVWRHEDLTDSVEVNQFGTVVLPRLGEIDVSRETHRSLRERVIRELRAVIVSESIEVVVLKRVRVLGEVNEPGVYYLDPTMTVADALALAGGTTPDAMQGMVVLRRGSETITADLRVDTRVADSPIRSGDELAVPLRGWLSRNTNAIIAAAGAFAGIVVAIVTAGGSGG